MAAPTLDELLPYVRPARMQAILAARATLAGPSVRYLHWDKLCQLKAPVGFSHAEWKTRLGMSITDSSKTAVKT